MRIMILAAGLGTRLKPITDKIPKPAIPLLNIPMIFYGFHNFSNVDQTIVNTFHLPDVLKKALQRNSRNFGAEVIHDGPNILGSGGGIKNAESFLSESPHFGVVNGDSVFIPEQPKFMKEAENLHVKTKALATLIVTEQPIPEGGGAVWVDSNQRIVGLGKIKPEIATKGYHFIGYYVFSNKIFKYLRQGENHIFDDCLIPAMKKGEIVQIYKTQGRAFETGNLNDYLETTHSLLSLLLNKNVFLSHLMKQFNPQYKLYSGDNILFETTVNTTALDILLAGSSLKIAGGVKLEGFVVLGNNVSIEAGCHIKNCVILDNAVIPKNSEIKNQLIL